MSAIPPNTIGSILQAAAQAAQTSGIRDADENRQAATVRAVRLAAEQRATSVSDTDQENEVGDSATSVGGQGRESGGEDSDTDTSEHTDADGGVHRDEEGQLHIDLQA